MGMLWENLGDAHGDLAGVDGVRLTVKRFLTLHTCPAQWVHHDLYLLHHGGVVFYVGQSECAYARLWTHLQDGFKGRSLVGKFVRNNWPRSMNFTVELLRSQDPAFAALDHRRDAVERLLIQRLHPCFNDVHNGQPTPLPAHYRPPQASVAYPRHLGKMMREAEQALRRTGNDFSWE